MLGILSLLCVGLFFVLRWSAIATHLPKRTDNEIKNYWNTHLKKRLAKMGIDPVTHKQKNDALLSTDGQSKNAANLSHMAQWESARLEAEARLVRESKLRSHSLQHQLSPPGFAPSSSASASASAAQLVNKTAWNSTGWTKSSEGNSAVLNTGLGATAGLESPTSTLTFSENAPPIMSMGLGASSMSMIEFVGTTSGSSETEIIKEEGEQEWKGLGSATNLPDYREDMDNSLSFTSSLHDMTISMEGGWTSESLRPNSSHVNVGNVMEEGFTNLLLNDSIDHNLSDSGKESDENSGGSGDGSDYYEDNKNYWNSILNLVNSSPPDSPMF
ncbi:hypothetical protein DITRI_Ditri16bG0111900 [Diplodiscus trichospermus]